MQSVGWGFLVVILLSGVRLLVRAWAWTLCTRPTPGCASATPSRPFSPATRSAT